MPSSSFECHESDHLAIFNAMLTFCATVKYISICNEVFHLKDLCSILIDLSPENEEKEENIERYHRISAFLKKLHNQNIHEENRKSDLHIIFSENASQSSFSS